MQCECYDARARCVWRNVSEIVGFSSSWFDQEEQYLAIRVQTEIDLMKELNKFGIINDMNENNTPILARVYNVQSMLKQALKKKNPTLEHPEILICPISLDLMFDPVFTSDEEEEEDNDDEKEKVSASHSHLPSGWQLCRKLRTNKSRYDKYFVSPDGKYKCSTNAW